MYAYIQNTWYMVSYVERVVNKCVPGTPFYILYQQNLTDDVHTILYLVLVCFLLTRCVFVAAYFVATVKKSSKIRSEVFNVGTASSQIT